MLLIPETDSEAAGGDAAVRLARAAGPYFVFRDASVEVVLASPSGGSPLMKLAVDDNASDGVLQRFRSDRMAADEFNDTVSLDQVHTDDFDAAFCVGLQGAIWRSGHNHSPSALIARLLGAGKPVAIMPSSIELAPKGAAEGLLIVGDVSKSSVMVAHALLGALKSKQIKPERNAS
jgi:hypothetical protein